MTTNVEPESNTSSLSYSLAARSPKSRCQQDCCLWNLSESPSLTLPGLVVPGFLGLCLQNSNLCLHLYWPFLPSPCVFLTRTLIGFRIHPDSPGWSNLEILNLMTFMKTLSKKNRSHSQVVGMESGHHQFTSLQYLLNSVSRGQI